MVADGVVQRHGEGLLGAFVEVENHTGAHTVHGGGVVNVIATHDGEFGVGRCDFAEAHVATVSSVQFRLDVRVGEKNKIERARRERLDGREARQRHRGGGRGQCGEEFSAVEDHFAVARFESRLHLRC
ncbi:MAG TPA: hypothetical protein VN881_10370 [Candidatus Acidoferrales bacterium]|nr:hypothetical protein [Candidatus Acidoferrales bacterium]